MNWKRNESLETEKMDDEMLVFDPESFKFFELNETMSFIWSLLETPLDEDTIVKLMSEEFDVEESELKNDIRDAISILLENNLIQKEN